ncbi:MAG: hypothetical protein ACRD3J_30860, partial [Thermoanaerobaculia bacterium]
RYEAFLSDRPEVPFDELCRTAARGRAHFAHRRALVLPGENHGLESAAIAEAYERGEDVDWREVYGVTPPRARAPHYAFQRQRFWFDDIDTPAEVTGPRRLRVISGATA